RAQRRAGAGLALGRARADGLGAGQHRPAPLLGRHLGSGRGQRAGGARRLRLVGRAMSDLLDRIKASIPALPPAEQRVAKLLLADARAFATLPVAELSER